MENFLKKAHKIMDGKKTITGGIMMIVGIMGFCEHLPGQDIKVLIDSMFDVLGSILFFIGVVHKIHKAIGTSQ